ncbi:hypothetical protein [Actinomadura macrotermitis]|uniref:Uncharacterized protein n=1 Tax=Actinomadura macrotermitis TaxID=2585200 RepID=A0A7K0BW91_9ACTN|nr:hypothetical protein [Actinomadura macrotermitis]MQY05439.1 hypothetical protein [Actinomadura macrotermitis]
MDVREVIEVLAREPQPAGGVDVRAAVKVGRRRLWWRRGAAGAGVLALGGGLVVGWPGPAREEVPAGPVAPKAFDPLVRHVEFGWVPAGMGARVVDNGTTYTSIAAGKPSKGKRSFPSAMLSVVFGAEGVPADNELGDSVSMVWSTKPLEGPLAEKCPGEDDEKLSGAPPVNGRRALWRIYAAVPVAGCRPVVAALHWEYAKGAWATLRMGDMPKGTDRKAVMLRVARTLRTGLSVPVAVPFQVKWPEGVRPISLREQRQGPNREVEVEAGEHHWPVESHVRRGQKYCSVSAGPSAYRERWLTPNTMFDGRPARRKDGLLTVFGVKGFDVEATCEGLGGGATDRLMRSVGIPG